MAKRTIVLRTDFPVDECMRRIREVTDPAKRTFFSFSGHKGSKPLLAYINSETVVVWKRIYYHNDFRPYFYGKLFPETNGARLEGSFGLSRLVKVGMAIWLALVGSSAVPELASFFKNSGQPLNDRAMDLIPLGMLACGFLLPQLGRLFSRGHERFIIDTLQTALAARVQTLDPNVPPIDAYTNRPIG